MRPFDSIATLRRLRNASLRYRSTGAQQARRSKRTQQQSGRAAGVQAARPSLVGSERGQGADEPAARRRSLGRQEHDEPASRVRSAAGRPGPGESRVPEVDGLVGEQAVGVRGVLQRQRQRRRVGRVLAEGVVRDARAHARLAVRAAQPQPLQPQRRHGLALQDQLRTTRPMSDVPARRAGPATPPHLVRDLPLRALRGVPLVLVDERLHHPLLAEGGEARRLVVQLVHELLRAVRLELQVCDRRRHVPRGMYAPRPRARAYR